MRFGELLKTAATEGKEKHVPVIDVADTLVTVTVGKETPHPNTVEHYIGWIQLYGVRASGQLVSLGQVTLTAVDTQSTARFAVKREGWKAFHALSYCNLHGVWESSVAL